MGEFPPIVCFYQCLQFNTNINLPDLWEKKNRTKSNNVNFLEIDLKTWSSQGSYTNMQIILNYQIFLRLKWIVFKNKPSNLGIFVQTVQLESQRLWSSESRLTAGSQDNTSTPTPCAAWQTVNNLYFFFVFFCMFFCMFFCKQDKMLHVT